MVYVDHWLRFWDIREIPPTFHLKEKMYDHLYGNENIPSCLTSSRSHNPQTRIYLMKIPTSKITTKSMKLASEGFSHISSLVL